MLVYWLQHGGSDKDKARQGIASDAVIAAANAEEVNVSS
jgi:hypothetical protein